MFEIRGLIECKKIDIVEAFAKYGAIDQIHIVTTPVETSADVAYKSATAALRAIADDNKVKVLDSAVSVNKKNETKTFTKGTVHERRIYVDNIKDGTNAEQLCKHFESCGEIKYFKLEPSLGKKICLSAVISFTEKAAVTEALKLDNSVLNDSNIKVIAKRQTKSEKHCDEKLTIILYNKQELDFVHPDKLESIFSACGEIDHVKLYCTKRVLAIVTFKTEKAAEKALKMTGKTKEGMELEIERFSWARKWTKVRVVNLHRDCTEEDLRKHFEKFGQIKRVILKRSFAIIEFEDSDGYCKSFLLNGTYIKRKIIFVEHNRSNPKALNKNNNKQRGFKRPFENGHTAFKAKKFKK